MQSRQDELVLSVIRSAEEAREFWIGFVDFVASLDTQQAFKEYANSIGVTDLTPEQKRQAFMNHVLERCND